MSKLVSIIIPVFNRANLIAETIESAISQTYKNIEIIIVDNCSTDNTWEVLNTYKIKYSTIKIFQNSENIGPVLNWKRCIDEVKGEYCKILFSDDLMADNFIENSLSVFNEDTAFVLSEIELFTSNGFIKSFYSYKKNSYTTKEYYEDVLLYNFSNFPLSPGCALFRTKDLKKSLVVDIKNEFDLEFKKFGAGIDLLFFLISAKSYQFINIAPNTKARFRYHENSFSVANDLELYYDYSKYFFVKKYFPNMLSKFKTVFWYKSKRLNKLYKIMGLIKAKIDWLFLLKLIVKKFLNKFIK